MVNRFKEWLAKMVLILVFGITAASIGYLVHTIILPLTLLQGLTVIVAIVVGLFIAYALWWALDVLGVTEEKR